MRPVLLSLVLGGSSLWGSQAEASLSSKAKDEKPVTTYFNSQKVPPMLELTPTNYESELKKSKYLLIKHFSPYCPHCIHFAPAYQTTYEYYYTSSPALAAVRDMSFTDFYNFRFASLNCIAYSDMCSDNGVSTFPMTILFKDGVANSTLRGVRSVPELSEAIEAVLRFDFPDSRPTELALPAPGASEAPKQGAASKSTSSGKSAETSKLDDALERPSSKNEKSEGKTAYGGDWKAPTSAELFKDRKPAKLSTEPNPEGKSVSLTPDSFERLVTLTSDPWFIKFYAPWCHHCQALAPTWEQVGKTFKGKLNIGEVNCEREKQLCKAAGVGAFPTMLFSRGTQRVEYNGLRGLGDLAQYGDQALELANGIPDVKAAEFEELEKTKDVVFVYFYDHATATEDFEALERLPLSLVGHANLVKTSDPKLMDRFKITTWPRLLVSREGRPTYFTPLTPSEMRNNELVLNWMQSVWLPLVPELTTANARQIMDGKIVALAVLDRARQGSFESGLREMKSAASEWMDRQIQEFQMQRKKLRDAKQMRIEEAQDRDDERAVMRAKTIRVDMESSKQKEVIFAWADGTFWNHWLLSTYNVDVTAGDRVIINDQDGHMFWDTTVTGNHILVSRTSVLETLDNVYNHPEALKARYTVNFIVKLFYDIRGVFVHHPFMSVLVMAGCVVFWYSWLRKRTRRARGHFRMDDLGIYDFKDSIILGQNGNSKAD